MKHSATCPDCTTRTRRAFRALAIVLLAAVPVLGLTTLALGSPLTAASGTDGVNAGISNVPFTFDSPTATLQRLTPEQAGVTQDGGGRLTVRGASGGAILLPAWTFTATCGNGKGGKGKGDGDGDRDDHDHDHDHDHHHHHQSECH